MNNLDPDVAEKPDQLIVYGGAGKAARNWQAFDALVRELRATGPASTQSCVSCVPSKTTKLFWSNQASRSLSFALTNMHHAF